MGGAAHIIIKKISERRDRERMLNLRMGNGKVATSGENQRKIPRSMRFYGNIAEHMLGRAGINVLYIVSAIPYN